ncbi:MAG: phospho-sugar mutase, partial [bacterium]|nr:phospho-sugar mutase [bacterium]
MSDDGGVRAAAGAWLAADPDRDTRAELESLLAAVGDSGVAGELQRRFEGRLRFGTAGLRAPLGAGPTRMNRVVVRQASAAVMATLPAGARVVVGHDARRNSAGFAADAAAFVAAAGGRALALGQVPTPVAAHAVVDRGAEAGIVITASHNPPEDNGYKLYDASGAQIVPPVDAAVEAHMAAAPLPPRGTPAPAGGGEVSETGAEAIERYLADIAERLAVPPPPGSPLRVVYTPLRGVGAAPLGALFERLNLPEPLVVASQAEPDGTFPTIAYPNPEEPGALDAAYELADRSGADLIIANDPDADRLAVAVPASRGWRRLSGDELG